ncbi:MAG: hypothetical protein QOH10_726, partial [Actinomycetota bacterium]|nr:hypothetical protein [Actinomycetota bacterium]
MVRAKQHRHTSLSRAAAFAVVALLPGLLPLAPAGAASKPSAPRYLSGTAGPSTGQVSLSWAVPVSTGGSPIATYAYSTSVNGGSTWTAVTPFNSTATAQNSTSVPGLTCPNTAPGSQGCRYRVYATNASGTSVASNIVALWIPPSAPKDLKGAATDATFAQVSLTWTASVTTGGLPVTYEVLSSMDGAAFASATTTSATSATVPCTGTTTCAYEVRASNSQGTSATTNPLTITTKPGLVANPRIQNTGTDLGAGTSSMLVSWYAPRVGMAVDHYEISQCNLAAGALAGCGANATWTGATQLAPSTTDPVSTTRTCSAGFSTCYFRVRAVNVRGGASGWRTFDAEPWAPYNVSVVPGPATGQVTIYFSGPSESGLGPNNAKQYRAFVCTSNCGTAASWTDSGLSIPYPPSGSSPYSAGTYACGGNASCQVRMQFVDGSSRASIATAAVTSRGAALSITTPVDGALTNDATPAFAGGCTIGSGNVTVTVTPGPVTFSTACSGSGTWSTNAPSLADGQYSAQATQAGTVGTSNTVHFTIDTVQPVVTVTSPANGSFRNTSSNSFSGACTTGDGNVTVTIGGTASSTLSAACNNGSWTTSTSLSDGPYTVSASQTDAAGNTGTSATNNFTVDTVPPVVTVTSPANGSYRNTAANTFSGACTTGDGNVTVTIGGTASATLSAACVSGSWTAGPTTLADGPYTVYASQTDAAGNTGTSATNNFTVDTVAPVVTLAQPANGSFHNTSLTTFSGTCTTGDGTVTVTIGGTANTTLTTACNSGS